MITAEEFFRNKLKELQPFRSLINLRDEVITAEQGMRWAHEFNKLVGGKTERESELLEALKDILRVYVALDDMGHEVLFARQAIAKAEGKL